MKEWPLCPRVAGPIISVACLFAIQFVSFLEGRGLGAVTLDLATVSASFLGGLVCGSLLFSPRFMRRPLAELFACGVTALGGFLWITAFSEGHPLVYAACFTSSLLLPPMLNRLFDISAQPGMHLGIAFGLGDFFWLFLYVLPEPPTLETMRAILVCLHLGGGFLAALSLRQQRRENDISFEGDSPQEADPLTRESMFYLTAVALVFFSLNALIDIPFYRMHEATFPVPAHVHLYIWAVYPLMGIYIDRHGADMLVLLLCLGGSLLSPISAVITEGTALYWVIYLVSLASRAAALMYLLLVFSKFRQRLPMPCLVATLPYIAMFLTFWMIYQWIQYFPCTTSVVLWTFFLSASFSYISSRIQYALTLSGILVPGGTREVEADSTEQEEEAPGLEPYCTAATLAHFSEKYGISAREQDVLRLIVDGYDTTRICETLHLSENTIKSHVRQLLRKTETRNRIALTALVFNEARKEARPCTVQA